MSQSSPPRMKITAQLQGESPMHANPPQPMKMGQPWGCWRDHVAAQSSGIRWCFLPAGESDARIFAAPLTVAPARGARRGDLSLELMRRSACVEVEALRAEGSRHACCASDV